MCIIYFQAIGYGIVAVTFALQPVMRWTCERLTGLWRLATADLFLFFSFLGTINVWRAVWGLLDIYFIPGERVRVGIKTLIRTVFAREWKSNSSIEWGHVRE